LFSPDPRCRFHQRFCRKAACKKASKIESQRKWKGKPENLWYWRGEKIFKRLASQGAENGKLVGSPNGDEKLPDDPVIVGILAVLCASKLKGQIEEMYQNVLAVGREILRKRAEASARAVGVARR
jgi:hypothetical protein